MIKQMRIHGAYIIDIARQIGCSERTVRRHLSEPECPRQVPSRRRMRKLEPYMAFIDMRLSEHVWNAQVIFQEIKAQGYDGGTTVLREYIQPKRRLRHGRETVRFETQHGYQLQHDWGEVEAEVAGLPCKINFAVNTLGYSRRFHVFAAPCQDAEHTYESLVQAFGYFGGSVKTVLVDNQKAAVLKHNNTGEVIFNAGFQSLAKHYGFTPRACRPHRPRTKGKVERMVGYVKHNFFVHYRRFDSFAHVNQLLRQWLAQEADQRDLRQFHQTPAERFEAEKTALQPLPPVRSIRVITISAKRPGMATSTCGATATACPKPGAGARLRYALPWTTSYASTAMTGLSPAISCHRPPPVGRRPPVSE